MAARAEAAPPADQINRVRAIVGQVTDPEIPVLTIADLGVLREVGWEDGRLLVVITPTYSGCPAMQAIEDDIHRTLRDAGYPDAQVRTRIAPAWTTDWLSDAGRTKLHEYGIAPPVPRHDTPCMESDEDISVPCPRCDSTNTTQVSRYGSTACKALYRCLDCLEPFDYFKCL